MYILIIVPDKYVQYLQTATEIDWYYPIFRKFYDVFKKKEKLS
jgi:hypothetical protein